MEEREIEKKEKAKSHAIDNFPEVWFYKEYAIYMAHGDLLVSQYLTKAQ